MSRLSLFFILAGTASTALAQAGTPLADKNIPHNAIPYKVDTDDGPRGIQVGYNRCNSTTEGQNSLCQTMYVNDIDDFCLWAPQTLATIGETEAGEVAWCTKPGRGTRLIPPGALQGIEYRVTPDYIQINGFVDQVQINIPSDDFGGELDPHGADQRGNPLGGLVYSNHYPVGNKDNNTFAQVTEWTNFMGGNAFCLKACNPQGRNPKKDCEHIYDRIGCAYNAPGNAANGTFVKCDADSAPFVGVYTANGAATTYFQPPESLGPITTVPYTATPAPTSNCVTYSSNQLYAAASTSAAASASITGSGTARPTGTAGGQASPSQGSGAAVGIAASPVSVFVSVVAGLVLIA